MPNFVIGDHFLEYAYLLDQTYTTKKILDTFSSFVWTERYCDSGDFIMVLPVLENIVDDLKINDYITIPESKEYMIVETMTLVTSAIDGDLLQIEGRSLSSILNRRIVWSEFKRGNYNLQSGITELINLNAVNPSDSKRKIPGLTVKISSDPAVTSLTSVFDVEEGENLFDVITDICSEKKIGYRMLPEGDGGFSFELYSGKDRTWDQEENQVVIFSNKYETLSNSQYVQSEKNYISNAVVVGDEYRAEVFRKNERTGLARREVFLQVNGDKTEDELIQKAKEQMSKRSVTEMFSGTIEPYKQFQYGSDYSIGDIVQVENMYGFSGRCRIGELMISRDAGGPVFTPSFTSIDKNNEEVEA